MSSLAEAFKAIRPDTSLLNSALELALTEVVREAQSTWPSLQIAPTDFVEYVAERLPESSEPLASLHQLFTNDLYLAAATIAGEDTALEAFSETYRPAVFRAAQKVEKQGVQADDTTQDLMEYLLLPRGDRPPALALYSGQGPLLAYVRVASLRKALKLLKKENKLPNAGGLDRVMELADGHDDPEIAVLKDKYRAEFKDAFHQALGELGSAERNLLRYHYLTELNTRQIGKLLGLHQSNVVRKLATVRAALLDTTRSKLMDNVGLGATKFQSIMMLVQSQLDVSIDRMLHSQKEEDPA